MTSSELQELVADAMARFDLLTPEEQREHRRAQRMSWVVGEMMLEYPEMTREDAVKIFNEVCP